ncbi:MULTISPECIES: helix-turn-helix transcriptional regulator [unclassified Saccharothrix]|uniref:helix-turn-helix transcriptional regulator n=1 Tax=unclassified Saccharothrix TaxID=2593673 RepID=UPI00307EE84C
MDTELGDFLRSRRAALRPEDLGLASYGSRRVPGLRREELAQLAGVSVTYYTRLEQGQSQNVSDNVLDAIARALRLTEDEAAHLRDLAKPIRRKRASPARAEAVRPSTAQLIAAMEGVAAVAMDRRSDVLAWNTLGHQLLAPHYAADSPKSSAERPNLTRMLFLDPATRDLYVNWEEEAKRSVASLRLVAGRHPDDRHLAELIGELCMNSQFFAALWSRHPVLNCTYGVKYFAHPQVGHLELQFEVVQLPDDSAHRILLYSAEAGTSAEAALRLLGRGAAEEGAVPIPRVVERSHRDR